MLATKDDDPGDFGDDQPSPTVRRPSRREAARLLNEIAVCLNAGHERLSALRHELALMDRGLASPRRAGPLDLDD
jgi:hypothetical protein